MKRLPLILLLFCSSCATLRAALPGIINCAEPLLSTLTTHVSGEVRAAHSFSVLDVLLGKLGPAVICAAAKIATAQPDGLADRELAAAWLKARGYRTRLP